MYAKTLSEKVWWKTPTRDTSEEKVHVQQRTSHWPLESSQTTQWPIFLSLSFFLFVLSPFFFIFFFLLNEVTVSWQRHLTAMSSTARREGGHLSKQMDNTKKCENRQTKERQKKENKWWTATESWLKVFPEPLGEREKIKWRSAWKWWKQVGPHKQQRSSRRNTTIR